jgi:hypothetical protein
VNALREHVVYGVAATAADTYDADLGLILRVVDER